MNITRTNLLEKLYQQAVKYEDTDTKKLLQFAQQGLILAEEQADDTYIAQFLYIISVGHFNKGYYDLTLQSCLKGLEVCVKIDNRDLLSKFHARIGAVYSYKDDFKSALHHYFEALKYNTEPFNGGIFDHIASIYYKQQDFPRSIKFLYKSLDLSKKAKNHRNTASTLVNISILQCQNKAYDDAVQSCQEALKISTLYQFNRVIIYANINIGNALVFKKDYILARTNYTSAYQIALSNNFSADILLCQQRIGQTYEYEDQLEIALDFYKKALLQAEEQGFQRNSRSCLELIVDLYQKMENFQSAFRYQSQLVSLQKEIIEKEQSNKIRETLAEKEVEIDILKEQNRKIERQNELLSQFAYVVAHDLKEPLRTIASFVNLLDRRYRSVFDQTALEYMDFIVNGTHNMNNLLSDLLQFVTLENESEQFKIAEGMDVVNVAIFNLKKRIDETNTTIIVQTLPKIRCNKVQLSQLFQNLIHNAIKFKLESTTPEIHIKIEKQTDFYKFSVQDNGIGIAKSNQEKIFKIFNRLHGREKYEGTGIGLSLCQKIVQLHGGEIWVESIVGQGSTFFFTLKK